MNEGAKLRLKNNYESEESLIREMKENLLTRKSTHSLMSNIVMCKQGDQSIEEFGKKLEHMMVELTFAQAEGQGSCVE